MSDHLNTKATEQANLLPDGRSLADVTVDPPPTRKQRRRRWILAGVVLAILAYLVVPRVWISGLRDTGDLRSSSDPDAIFEDARSRLGQLSALGALPGYGESAEIATRNVAIAAVSALQDLPPSPVVSRHVRALMLDGDLPPVYASAGRGPECRRATIDTLVDAPDRLWGWNGPVVQIGSPDRALWRLERASASDDSSVLGFEIPLLGRALAAYGDIARALAILDGTTGPARAIRSFDAARVRLASCALRATIGDVKSEQLAPDPECDTRRIWPVLQGGHTDEAAKFVSDETRQRAPFAAMAVDIARDRWAEVARGRETARDFLWEADTFDDFDAILLRSVPLSLLRHLTARIEVRLIDHPDPRLAQTLARLDLMRAVRELLAGRSEVAQRLLVRAGLVGDPSLRDPVREQTVGFAELLAGAAPALQQAAATGVTDARRIATLDVEAGDLAAARGLFEKDPKARKTNRWHEEESLASRFASGSDVAYDVERFRQGEHGPLEALVRDPRLPYPSADQRDVAAVAIAADPSGGLGVDTFLGWLCSAMRPDLQAKLLPLYLAETLVRRTGPPELLARLERMRVEAGRAYEREAELGPFSGD